MLKKFAVTNFRGFADRIEWDLSRHASYAYNSFAIRDGIVKNGIIYGPNGSGKSNFSMALFDIENHLSDNEKDAEYYKNFAYLGRENVPVKFEYEFDFGGIELRYLYEKNDRGQLVSEKLLMGGDTVFSRSRHGLYVDQKAFPMADSVRESIERSENGVSMVKFLATTFPLQESHGIMRLMKFVDSMLWFRNVDVRGYMGLERGSRNMDEEIIKSGHLEDFAKFIKDISGQEFDLVAGHSGKDLMCVIDGKEREFHKIISTGTRGLEVLYYWLLRMDKASFVFIDEFDAFYHFELAKEVCKRLFAFDFQAFVSTHNTYLLDNDLLRPDCYFIIYNGKIRALNECTDRELRFAHNLEKIYRSGVLTADYVKGWARD